jgi:hypothetical protein
MWASVLAFDISVDVHLPKTYTNIPSSQDYLFGLLKELGHNMPLAWHGWKNTE